MADSSSMAACQQYVPFQGNFVLPIDAKGRVTLPSPLRVTCMSNGAPKESISFVLYLAAEKALSAQGEEYFDYLQLFLPNRWNELLERMADDDDQQTAFAIREMYNNCATVSLDGSGRLLLSKDRLEDLGITQDAVKNGQAELVVLGSGQWIEIWSRSQFDRREGSRQEQQKRRALATQKIIGSLLSK